MKITIHQPEHFPYLGFFQKMQAADLFILLDDVQFTKGNFQNRNKFQNAKGEDEWFTITLQQHPNKYLIKDVEVNSELNWRPALINKLKQKFNKDFSEIYSHNKLIDINVSSIEYCRKELGITTPMVLSSTLNINSVKSERLSDICKHFNATEYLSGKGGKEYLDESVFDCKVTYFEPNVSDYYTTLQHI
jgi:hypothetical protein